MPELYYGPELTALLDQADVCPLDAGRPVTMVRDVLRRLEPVGRLGDRPVVDTAAAQACWSGLWLRFNFLDESHRISQELPDSTGSFWHAIMHRREGDFGNSKYWWRQVGRHRVFDRLSLAVRDLLAEHERRATPVPPSCQTHAARADWDPYGFVDLCQAAVRGASDAEGWCRAVQQIEWKLLFDDCWRRAVGEPDAE